MIVYRPGRRGRYVPMPRLMAAHAALLGSLSGFCGFAVIYSWVEVTAWYEYGGPVLFGLLALAFAALSFAFGMTAWDDRARLKERKGGP